MKSKKNTDWIGLWYEIHKELGANDLFTFGIVDTKTNSIAWHDFSHAQYDGIGAISQLMEERGVVIANLPQIKIRPKLSWWQKIKIIMDAAATHKAQKIQWKSFDSTKTFRDIHDVGWFILNEQETRTFQKCLAREKLSENTFILSLASSVILSELAEDGSEGTWLFPINMRGLIARRDVRSNHSSGILIKASANSTPSEIGEQIKGELRKCVHLGNWWLLHIGKIIGLRGMKYIAAKNSRSCFCIGSFSNLGKWDFSRYPQVSAAEAWLPLPPGRPNYPIGIGIMTWNGKFAMILKVHPSVAPNATIQHELTEKIKAKIVSVINNSTSGAYITG